MFDQNALVLIPQRKYLAAALVLSRKLSANMCNGLLYLERLIERNFIGQFENIRGNKPSKAWRRRRTSIWL